jgi:hypothetical protein
MSEDHEGDMGRQKVYRRGESPVVDLVRKRAEREARVQGGETGEFFMSLWSIARGEGVSRNTVQKAVLTLIAQGVLTDLTPEVSSAAHKYRLDWDKVGGFHVSGERTGEVLPAETISG